MKGDFSRDTFDSGKHYAGVLKQQGKVDLDADWNEQNAIQLHREQTTTRDVVGACGAPMEHAGFAIDCDGNPDLTISAGRIYVDGILGELEADASYNVQPDHPQPPALNPVVGRTDLVYLDVWQRHITAIEDPDLREKALGGPDTTTRVQTIWQVKLRTDVGNVTCADQIAGWPPAPSGGLLTTDAVTPEPPEDPCTLASAGGYQGLDNRLYRVEIHNGGNIGAATFKWSRDNGSVVYAIEDFIDGQPTNQVRVANLGRDRELRLAVDDWVEVLDDATDLSATAPGALLRVTDVDEADRLVTLSGNVSGYDLARHPKLRRWDQGQDAILLTSDILELEDGVQVAFSGSNFHRGDYWMFPARSITGEVEILTEAACQGIQHHYCSLALVTWQMTGDNWTPDIQDCRHLFPPLTQLTRFFYVGGNGQEALPGQTLPELLRVGVMNGLQPVAGARVEFSATNPGATLDGSPNSVTVFTGADGIASCAWQPDGNLPNPENAPSQVVTAQLQDASGVATDHPMIYFNANLSIASQVWYDTAGDIHIANPGTVQQSLTDLTNNYSLHYVSGDGQEAVPGQGLPGPLQVRVSNGQWPVARQVEFRIVAGNGQLNGGPAGQPVTVTSNPADGLAECAWTPDQSTPLQRVEASLVSAPDLTVCFNARLRTAESVYFNPDNCDRFDSATTNVQAALDALCGMAGVAEPGIVVTEILRRDMSAPIPNDSEVPANVLAQGIHVACDSPLSPEAVNGKPIFSVALEMPYPLSSTDRQLWGLTTGTHIGYQWLKLAASHVARASGISWAPVGETQDWLVNRLFQLLTQLELPQRLLAHLTVKGNFLWAETQPDLYLDGNGFGRPGDGRTDLALPTGDGVRGGDLEMWFWLVPAEVNLAINDDSTNTFAGVPIVINVLNNDSGNPPLNVIAVSQPNFGTATNGGTTVVYTPFPGIQGVVDQFTYTVQDGAGNTGQGTISVLVQPRILIIGELPTDVTLATVDFTSGDVDLAADPANTFSGSGFGADEEVTLVAMTDDGVALELGRTTADNGGNFRVDLSLAENLPAGDFEVRALGGDGSQGASGSRLRIRRRGS